MAADEGAVESADPMMGTDTTEKIGGATPPVEIDPWRVIPRWRRRWLLFPPVHAAWYATRWVGLRDRLRCPECRAVGTWKPHGTFSARIFYKDRPVRRWICKWCGLYIGPEGRRHARVSTVKGCWVLPEDAAPGQDPLYSSGTPMRVLRGSVLKRTWPWRG